MNNLPEHIPLVFGLTTLATLILVYRSIRSSRDKRLKKNAWKYFLGFTAWLFVQALLSLNGVYSDHTDAMPPFLFLLGVLPFLLVYVWLFFTEKGRSIIDHLSQKRLTWIHVVRIPVEVVLWWLFLDRMIPELMTFEGWNFDILSGISALLIVHYGYRKKKRLSNGVLLAWNIIGLGLVLFILTIAVLSAPFPFQQLAIEQPNIAVLYFPFSWLPTFVVPVVVLSHLVVIRQLVRERKGIV